MSLKMDSRVVLSVFVIVVFFVAPQNCMASFSPWTIFIPGPEPFMMTLPRFHFATTGSREVLNLNLYRDLNRGNFAGSSRSNLALEEVRGNRLRFDMKTGRHYSVGEKGPCGPNMSFHTLPDSKLYGVCDCDYDTFQRPLVYMGKKCHLLYSQGYCDKGKWLIINQAGFLECKENPCMKHSRKENSYVLFNGECVRLKSKSKYCKSNEMVTFLKGSVYPGCVEDKSDRRVYKRQISRIGNLQCKSGTRRVRSKCVRFFSFKNFR